MKITRFAFVAVAVSAALLAAPTDASAKVIAGNFCSVAQIVDFPAGVNETPWWNDLTDPAGFGANEAYDPPAKIEGTNPDFKYSDLSDVPDGVSVEWDAAGGSQNTNDDVVRPTDVPTGHDQLFAGYLQSSLAQSGPLIQLYGAGMDTAFTGPIDIYLYFDGDEDVEGTGKGTFELYATKQDYLDGFNPLQTYYGRDDGSDFPDSTHTGGPGTLADYEQITSTDPLNPTVGNYVVFSGVTTDTFYVRIVGQAGNQGAALNGFEIVPEPTTMALLGLGGFGAFIRRRRA